jgi:hypothetical protein
MILQSQKYPIKIIFFAKTGCWPSLSCHKFIKWKLKNRNEKDMVIRSNSRTSKDLHFFLLIKIHLFQLRQRQCQKTWPKWVYFAFWLRHGQLVWSRGLVVKADDSWWRGHEFEPRHRILDDCSYSHFIEMHVALANFKFIKFAIAVLKVLSN